MPRNRTEEINRGATPKGRAPKANNKAKTYAKYIGLRPDAEAKRVLADTELEDAPLMEKLFLEIARGGFSFEVKYSTDLECYEARVFDAQESYTERVYLTCKHTSALRATVALSYLWGRDYDYTIPEAAKAEEDYNW